MNPAAPANRILKIRSEVKELGANRLIRQLDPIGLNWPGFDASCVPICVPGQRIVERNLDIQPTIRVRPGFPVRVLVHKDLVLRPWRG